MLSGMWIREGSWKAHRHPPHNQPGGAVEPLSNAGSRSGACSRLRLPVRTSLAQEAVDVLVESKLRGVDTHVVDELACKL